MTSLIFQLLAEAFMAMCVIMFIYDVLRLVIKLRACLRIFRKRRLDLWMPRYDALCRRVLDLPLNVRIFEQEYRAALERSERWLNRVHQCWPRRYTIFDPPEQWPGI